MTKRIRFFNLLVLITNFLFSQINVYKPFPQSFAVWKVSCWCNINQTGPSYNTTQKFQVSGDTIVNTVSYKKVNCAAPIYGNPSQSSGPISTCFLYRNDSINRKVYYLNPAESNPVEHLWYDFNLVVGDTLKDTYAFTNPAWAGNSNPRRIVTSIDSVVFCGKYYKRFNFTCVSPGFSLALIEGVGFEDHFINTGFPDCPFEPINVYSTLFSTCIPTAIEEFNDSKNSLRLFPNPTNSELKVNSDFPLNNYTIFNNLGGLVTSENIFANKIIDVSKISNGLYILKVQDDKGNSFYSKFIKE